MPRNIVLINPPWFFPERVEFLSQNLAIGYLAGYLEREGHNVSAIDALVEGENRLVDVQTKWGHIKRAGLLYEEIVERIRKETEIIGITAPFTHHAIIVRELSTALKKALPSVKIILGGVYPSTMPEKALSEGVDYIVKGEGEIPIAKIACGEDPAQIQGVWFRDKDGNIVGNGTAEMVYNLDDIPYPAWHLLPMEKYHRLSSRGRVGERAATVITSRGCPFNCTFCSVHAVYGWTWRARSPQNVIDELKLLRDKFGIEHIEFEDDNLTLDIRRAEVIFDSMIGLGLAWSCSNGIRVDKLDRKLLVKMKESGCRVLNLAFEHGDPEMLKIMDKKLDLEKVEEVTSICFELGIPMVGFWVICHPGETRERFERGLKFAKKLKDRGMYGFGVHLAWPFPGTRLFRMCKENGWLTYPDVDERLIFPGPFYIECPEFDAAEASRRMVQAKTVLGVDGYYSETKAETLMSILAGALLGYGLLKVSPVRLGNKFTKGSYPPEITPEGVKFKWSKPRSSITISPVSSRAKKLLVKVHSIADKQMTIKANNLIRYDDSIKAGDNELTIELGKAYPLNSKLELEFITPPTIPCEIDMNSRDNRELGIVIRWLKLL
jgi:magnesium-protoporphyrin IX monomethyl ester (oxidative) cyclase